MNRLINKLVIDRLDSYYDLYLDCAKSKLTRDELKQRLLDEYDFIALLNLKEYEEQEIETKYKITYENWIIECLTEFIFDIVQDILRKPVQDLGA